VESGRSLFEVMPRLLAGGENYIHSDTRFDRDTKPTPSEFKSTVPSPHQLVRMFVC